jgi:BirA family biotin operon repressor/biotin-[acetyl-CoA-carboxylase] ligase
LSSLNPIGTPFIELLTVNSTNNYAMGLVHAGMARHGTVVFTHEQTKGKGQRNKEWTSQKGQNIALSAIVEPVKLNSPDLFLLSMATALGVYEFLTAYAIENVKIKWPNDVYWRDRKAAGILIENVWQGNEWKFAVAGIGININQTDFGELNLKAVSVKQITGKEFTPLQLAGELCAKLDQVYRQLAGAPEDVAAAYKAHLYKKNEVVRLKKDSRVFEAIVKEVNNKGQLVVQHSIEENFEVGEVEWII